MATSRMDITSFVGKLLEESDVDLLRDGVRVLAQAVMETEVSRQIGAGPLRAERRAPQRRLGNPLPVRRHRRRQDDQDCQNRRRVHPRGPSCSAQ